MRLLWIGLLAACSRDADGDGFLARDDCDDRNPAIHTGAEEVCDRIDNDCDGTIDLSAVALGDVDLDGDLRTTQTKSYCDQPVDESAGVDCDETDRDVHEDMIEVCGDGVDNDCDGVVDTWPCADWVYLGETMESGVGRVVAIASSDASMWAESSSSKNQAMPVQARGHLVAAGEPDLGVAWVYGGEDTATLAGHALDIEAWGGGAVLALTTRSGTYDYGVALLTLAESDKPELVANLDRMGIVEDLALAPAGASLRMAVGGGFQAFVVDDPHTIAGAIPTVASLRIDPTFEESGLGQNVVLLPDPGGDGIPELAVASGQSDKGVEHDVFLFDGMKTGSLTTDDADAVIRNVGSVSPYVLASSGDLNGDGHTDLNVGKHYFGPFDGVIDGQSYDVAFGKGYASGVSFDGDDQVDLAATLSIGTGVIGLLHGPIAPGNYMDNPDYTIDFNLGYEQYSLFPADVDEDGHVDLLVACDGWLGWSQVQGRGLIAGFDLEARGW